nr:Uncharacterised protein [Klebsiella pneumoniae]
MGGQPLRQIGQFSLTLLLSAQGARRMRARSAVLASKRAFTSLIRCRVCARPAVCSCWRSHRGRSWAAGWASSSFASAGRRPPAPGGPAAAGWRPAAAAAPARRGGSATGAAAAGSAAGPAGLFFVSKYLQTFLQRLLLGLRQQDDARRLGFELLQRMASGFVLFVDHGRNLAVDFRAGQLLQQLRAIARLRVQEGGKLPRESSIERVKRP